MSEIESSKLKRQKPNVKQKKSSEKRLKSRKVKESPLSEVDGSNENRTSFDMPLLAVRLRKILAQDSTFPHIFTKLKPKGNRPVEVSQSNDDEDDFEEVTSDGQLVKRHPTIVGLDLDKEQFFNDETTASIASSRLSRASNKSSVLDDCRTKPSIESRHYERSLQGICTRGVVQMFNVVVQQKKLRKKEAAERRKRSAFSSSSSDSDNDN